MMRRIILNPEHRGFWPADLEATDLMAGLDRQLSDEQLYEIVRVIQRRARTTATEGSPRIFCPVIQGLDQSVDSAEQSRPAESPQRELPQNGSVPNAGKCTTTKNDKQLELAQCSTTQRDKSHYAGAGPATAIAPGASATTVQALMHTPRYVEHLKDDRLLRPRAPCLWGYTGHSRRSHRRTCRTFLSATLMDRSGPSPEEHPISETSKSLPPLPNSSPAHLAVPSLRRKTRSVGRCDDAPDISLETADSGTEAVRRRHDELESFAPPGGGFLPMYSGNEDDGEAGRLNAVRRHPKPLVSDASAGGVAYKPVSGLPTKGVSSTSRSLEDPNGFLESFSPPTKSEAGSGSPSFRGNGALQLEKKDSSLVASLGSIGIDPGKSMSSSFIGRAAGARSEIIEEFRALGLGPEALCGLESCFSKRRLGVPVSTIPLQPPTPVQRLAIPVLLSPDAKRVVLAAETGSGKTLAFLLPIVHRLKVEEKSSCSLAPAPRRPRAIALATSRELASQLLDVTKSLSHGAKLASVGLIGGGSWEEQKRRINGVVDVVVGTPARVLGHWRRGNLSLTEVRYVIIDEIDAMLMQGFGSEIRDLMRALFSSPKSVSADNDRDILFDKNPAGEYPDRSFLASVPFRTNDPVEFPKSFDPPNVVCSSATITPAVKRLLSEFPMGSSSPQTCNDKRAFRVVEVSGLHRAQSLVKHKMIDAKGSDKIRQLLALLKATPSGPSNGTFHEISRTPGKLVKTIVFCNTVPSCHAVGHALTEADLPSQEFHGEMPPETRRKNLQSFQRAQGGILVCTDLASRGLDFYGVKRVVSFDFPLSPLDYIHRSLAWSHLHRQAGRSLR
eukprot:GHVT01019828.1.p1 GENE.GHVT01019828.1~~GHVT01019828.1.p1  ORF type:complete len:841 (+),score=87.35 GHVT01019828.1:944-3466(+)